MSRPKQARSVPYERHLARRIKEEREARGWTFDNLALRMRDAGCPMDRSAIYRIETGNPPRRITVDEAYTFADVFGLKLEAMIMPPVFAKSREARKLYRRYRDAWTRYEADAAELQEARAALLAVADAGFEDQVLEAIAAIGTIELSTLETDPRPVEPELLVALWRMTEGDSADKVLDAFEASAKRPREECS